MKQITQESVQAFLNKKSFRKGNMVVSFWGTTVYLELFGNIIAKIEDNILSITSAGWQTKTTKERLNALPNVSIYQKKGVWYLNGVVWDGKWIEV